MNDIEIRHPWYVAFIAAQPERTKAPTALEAALFSAVERALYDPRHPLHQQTFGFYGAPGAGHRRSHARQISQSEWVGHDPGPTPAHHQPEQGNAK
jgi:hypothetical protein